MAVLGIDIGSAEIKAVLVETTWRESTLIGVYCEPTPSAAVISAVSRKCFGFQSWNAAAASSSCQARARYFLSPSRR